jgi:hypothetical protein
MKSKHDYHSHYKVEGNMLFGSSENDNLKMLTCGPFYYHNEENAKKRLPLIRQDIINWVNSKNPDLNLQPENEIVLRSEKLITFDIKAWKSETDLQPVKCIITVDNIFIDD